MKTKLAVFDFDGTITKRDTFLDFILFATGKSKFSFGVFILSPVIIAYFLNLITNKKLKEIFLSYFFKKWSKEEFLHIADIYSEKRLPDLIKNEAMKRINWHKWRKHDVIIITASIKNWIVEWCNFHDIRLIANELEFNGNFITGKLSTTNCYGIEKVKRLTEQIDLTKYKYIFAYGDGRGDKELLEFADEKYFRNFKE
ncbi:MAG: HAD-IB family hydrolase [Bacteroidales bacterium]|nr:HAD-IB family hydrolase [Bacteroidales bacterium]